MRTATVSALIIGGVGTVRGELTTVAQTRVKMMPDVSACPADSTVCKLLLVKRIRRKLQRIQLTTGLRQKTLKKKNYKITLL